MRDADRRALRFGLQLDPLESPGITLSDEEVDAIIADTLAANRKAAEAEAVAPPPPAPERRRRADSDVTDDDLACLTRVENYAGAPVEIPEEEAPVAKAPPRTERVRARRRLRRIALGGLLVSLLYFWPWFVPLVLLALFWLGLVVFILAGHDGASSACLGFYRWLDARWPQRAERLRATLDRGALRLDAILDRLPERWTAGLYLPDFSRENLNPDAFAGRPDPFDRLSAELRGRKDDAPQTP
ncbi:hypothetical protein D6850_07540 [Roseovarius spongiae]|uniref:Uncharacterized protein n=1 Tax=Roseovarius spongiae TaxID=2320272 RepID=A0A3A8B5F9_9RHOB|nr:hypothetical protein [Roseovarius spongiae]RKF14726.1 hypothetical protein D6850_07540 [Roseovarius spongiae]